MGLSAGALKGRRVYNNKRHECPGIDKSGFGTLETGGGGRRRRLGGRVNKDSQKEVPKRGRREEEDGGGGRGRSGRTGDGG